jgi:hypothetical protein
MIYVKRGEDFEPPHDSRLTILDLLLLRSDSIGAPSPRSPPFLEQVRLLNSESCKRSIHAKVFWSFLSKM